MAKVMNENPKFRMRSPKHIADIAEGAKHVLQLGHCTGEGWFLTGEMIELINSGVPNIACVQPFACLPNHVTGKGMIMNFADSTRKPISLRLTMTQVQVKLISLTVLNLCLQSLLKI